MCEWGDEPFLGSLRELNRSGTSGGKEWMPDGSVRLLPKVLRGKGRGKL